MRDLTVKRFAADNYAVIDTTRPGQLHARGRIVANAESATLSKRIANALNLYVSDLPRMIAKHEIAKALKMYRYHKKQQRRRKKGKRL